MILNLGTVKQALNLLTSKRYAGNPISRVFRRAFESKKMRGIVGLNLAFCLIFTSLTGGSVSAFSKPATLAEVQALPSQIELTTKSSIRVPVDVINISQGYHFLHPGIDLADTKGSPVYPAMEGTVEVVSYGRISYGNHIIINHGNGYQSLYAHLSKINVKPGDEVDTNTVIGLVGSTGWSTGNHLHFEIREDGHAFNPQTILPILAKKSS